MGLSCKFSLKPIHWDMEWLESLFLLKQNDLTCHILPGPELRKSVHVASDLFLCKNVCGNMCIGRVHATCPSAVCRSEWFLRVSLGVMVNGLSTKGFSLRKKNTNTKKKQCWFTAWNTIKKGIKKVHWKRALQSGHLRRRAQLWALQRTRIRHIFFAAAYFPTRFDALHHCMFASLHCSLHSPFKHRKKKQSHCIVESKLWQRWPRQASQGSGVAQLRLEHWAFTRCLSSLSSQGLD